MRPHRIYVANTSILLDQATPIVAAQVEQIAKNLAMTRRLSVYLAIKRLKRAQCMQQRQAVGINHYILVKIIDALPDTMAGTRNKALLSMGYDFLGHRSELVALQSSHTTFTKDGSLTGMIRKNKTNPFSRGRLVFGSERSAKLLKKWL